MTLKTSKQLAPVKPGINCFGYGNKADSVTIHQTGNTNKGANAKMHAKLQSGVYGSSWQWQVDDVEAIQSFENNVSCYHASDGRGPGNLNSIAIEGCINSDGDYVKTVHNMAELAAKVLKEIGKDTNSMFQHNHFDTKYRKNCPAQIRAGKDGINWALFVQMVKDNMKGSVVTEPVKPSVSKTIDQLANEVIAGTHGSGDVRKKALGSKYDAVQSKVNEILGGNKTVPVAKSIDTLVKETIAGVHGNGEARKKSLGSNYDAVMAVINGKSNSVAKPVAKSIETLANETIAGKHGSGDARKKSLGSNYDAVQKRVNEILGGKKSTSKSLDTIASEVIKGLWGNGQDRTNRLKKAGYNPDEVQKVVNKKL